MIDESLPTGSEVAGYVIERVLGQGGFAITYLAHDAHLVESRVALKEYFPQDLARRTQRVEVAAPGPRVQAYREGLERFLEEARTLIRLPEHPGVVRAHRYVPANGTAYLVMEYVAGESLADVLKRQPRSHWDEERVRRLAAQLLDALRVVHGAGVWHRDLNPSNVLLRADGRPVLIDFGASRQVQAARTRTGQRVATSGYSPPEQYGQDYGEPGAWSDLYALGATLYEVVTGMQPADSLARLVAQRKGRDPLVLAVEAASGRYSAELLGWIDWHLQLEETARPQTAEQSLAELPGLAAVLSDAKAVPRTAPVGPKERFTQSQPAEASNATAATAPQLAGAVPSAQRAGGKGPAIAEAAAVLLLAAAGGLWWWRGLSVEAPVTALTQTVVDPQPAPAPVEPSKAPDGDPAAATAAGESQLVVGGRGAQVRQQPNSRSGLLAELVPGTLVVALGESEGESLGGTRRWMRVRHGEAGEGFVSASRVRPLGVRVDMSEVTGDDRDAVAQAWGCDTGAISNLELSTGTAELDGSPPAERVLAYIDPSACSPEDCTQSGFRLATASGQPLGPWISCGWIEVAARRTAGHREVSCLTSYQGQQDHVVFRWDGQRYATDATDEGSVIGDAPDQICFGGPLDMNYHEPESVEGEAAEAEPEPAAEAQPDAPVTAMLIAGNVPPPSPGRAYRRVLRSGDEGPEMVVVPGGSFVMGSPESEEDRDDDEGPQRRVRVRSFAMGVTELTFADWDRCVAAGGCSHRPDDKGWGRGDRPVIDVSWEDAQEYVQWLSSETGRRYRLPTEAEWEYAARAGTVTAYWWGDGIDRSRANYGTEDCCGGKAEGADRWEYMSPVKSFPPNPWGLYDTSGNVWEWVQDCYKGSYQGAPADGSAVEASGCDRRVLRGAAWLDKPAWLRSANRDGNHPTDRDVVAGFRLAEDL